MKALRMGTTLAAWIAVTTAVLATGPGRARAQAGDLDAPSAPTDGTAALTLESTGDPLEVWLTPRDGRAAGCVTPCTLAVRPGPVWLETEAPGVRANRGTFAVPTTGGHLVLQAADGQAYAWGILSTIFGAVSITGAATALGLFLGSAPNDPYNQSMAGVFGGFGGAMGALSLTLGLALFFSNQTGFELRPSR